MIPPLHLHFNRGFSLLEIILSTTMLALLLAMILGMINDSTLMKDRVLREDKEYLQVQAALERFDHDFSQSYSPLYFEVGHNDSKILSEQIKIKNASIYPLLRNMRPDDDPPISTDIYTPTETFELRSRSLKLIPSFIQPNTSTFIFFSRSHRRKRENSKQSYYSWIKYSLEKSEEENRLEKAPYALVRHVKAKDVYAPEFQWKNIKRQILVMNVEDLTFEFWDRSQKKFINSLQTLKANALAVPQFIRLTLIWRTSQNERKIDILHSTVLMPTSFNVKLDESRRWSYPSKDSLTKKTNAR